MEKGKILPVKEGFAFECQCCGKCCNQFNVQLSLDDLHYFVEHNMEVAYFINVNKTTGKIAELYPCKPMGTRCTAQDVANQRCLIYQDRPYVCRLYPFIYRLYYKTPPRMDEILKSLEHTDTTGIRLKDYYHKVDKDRWLFVGYRVVKDCPGLGKGTPWTKHEIKRHIADNLYYFLSVQDKMGETYNAILDMLHIETETDALRWFELVTKQHEDDSTKTGIYKAKEFNPARLIGDVPVRGRLIGCDSVKGSI